MVKDVFLDEAYITICVMELLMLERKLTHMRSQTGLVIPPVFDETFETNIESTRKVT